MNRLDAVLRPILRTCCAAATAFAAVALSAADTPPAAVPSAPPIRLDTLGYLPGHEKKATIAVPCSEFQLVRVGDGKVVLSGKTAGPARNEDTGESLYTADFSAWREAGDYRLEVAGVGQSAPFRIAADVYRDAFATVVRGMYLWRCGTAVDATYGGNHFHQDACHLEDAWLDYVDGWYLARPADETGGSVAPEYVRGDHVKRDATGGWHDAGDYNKYIVNAGVSVGAMLRAWEDFGPQVKSVGLGIPESGGALPDFLAEVKWETDWILKMQAEDGSVYHKLSTLRFGGFIMPATEKEERFFVPWGSAATADFVAMLAQAARCMRPYDAAYADRCLAAARKSYEFLGAHPENHAPDQKRFRTGGYVTGDADDRLWAAAELWETTGSADALRDFEARVRAAGAKFDEHFDWSEVGNLGLITYLFSGRPGRDAALVAQLRANLTATADATVALARAHGYARPLGAYYYWGGNGGVARQAILLRAAHRVSARPEYLEVALDGVHHLFGRNVHGRSYVTGIGANPPMHPHDRRSGADEIVDPWPGYLVGGPNPKAVDWYDVQPDARTNEIAINWNTALIYALAGFLEGADER